MDVPAAMRRAALLVLVAVAALPAAAYAHRGNPNYLSDVTAVQPGAGLRVSVLNRDDRLLLESTAEHTIVVEGYEKEPYARIGADGSVEVNLDSPAYYSNRERFSAPVPKSADGKGEPRWKQLSESGRFEWHDHRMHWMGKNVPPQVIDQSQRTKIFDWTVPLQVDGRPGRIAGTLTWTPQESGDVPLDLIACRWP
jgi:hypothetical protein